MKTKSYIFAGIIAAITMGNAYATGENTVTSKSYVDAMDATKQDKITAKTTGNVVTYNGTSNGQTKFDEVGIYNGGAQYNSSTDSGKLITAGTVANMATTIESITIPDNKLTCYNDRDGCTLWQISTGTTALTAQGTLAPLTEAGCSTTNDCPACTVGTKACTNNRCECQLKANGQRCTDPEECQSGNCDCPANEPFCEQKVCVAD